MIKGWKNAHGDIARFRRNAAAARKAFVVKALNKDGAVSKMRVDPMDYFATREEAETRVTMLMSMNPGRRWTIVENV